MPRTKSTDPQVPETEIAVEADAPDVIAYGRLPTLVGYSIRKAHNRVFQTWQEMFADLHVAFGQYSVLLLVGLNPGMSQGTLAAATGIERSSIVPITDLLAKRGWIRRTRRRDNRRTYSLRITPAGQSILDQAEAILQAHDERLAARLSEPERRLLVELLAKVADESPTN